MRAGLGLDPQALKKLSGMVFRLAFTPCLVETTVVAVFSHLLQGSPGTSWSGNGQSIDRAVPRVGPGLVGRVHPLK